MSDTATAISAHYHRPGLERAILDGLRSAGVGAAGLSLRDLAAMDEFHVGGRRVTEEVADRLEAAAGARVLDIGCGVGGAARVLAQRVGALVVGIDLTLTYVAAAGLLTRLAGLDRQVSFAGASGTALPFADGVFDAVSVLHVGMNISDKPGLATEAARVLAPGGRVLIYDVMRVGDGVLRYPTPWAPSESASFLARPEDYRAALAAAGLRVVLEDHREDVAQKALVARPGTAGEPPPLGLHLLMGDDMPAKVANLADGMARRVVLPVLMVARKDG